MNFRYDPAVFVMPHWTDNFRRSKSHLQAAIEGIVDQTDPNWRLVIVDDASPDPLAAPFLERVRQKYPSQVHVILKETNEGAGVCRNLGIEWANSISSPFILFNDADDLSVAHRLATVRRVFADRSPVGVVYSRFHVVDQEGCLLAREEMTPSVAEVIEAHDHHPPQGYDAWIAIGTETGYINHTSSTAVRTDLAIRFPFPAERVSEDSHTWFRYSAGGGYFVFVDEPLSMYRGTRDTAGSSSRAREGGKRGFYATKARIDEDGFRQAIELALANGAIQGHQAPDLLVKFHIRLAETLAKEGDSELAMQQIQKARAVSEQRTKELMATRDFDPQLS